MRGSIAIWHDKDENGANGYAPRVEVHINIWKGDRDSKTRRVHLFDIGLLFKEIRSLKTLALYLPFVVTQEEITDLFDIMNDDTTLSAIFNETLTAKRDPNTNDFFAAHDESGKKQFHVSSCKSDRDMTTRTIDEGDSSGTVITFRQEFLDRLNATVGDQYFRLRIPVPYETKNGFISEIHPKESAFLSTISTNEVVEFRLNERRNFSKAILKELEGSIDLIEVSAVQYFLIRDMTVEMTQSHTSFKKMRRLERKIWDKYLEDEPQFSPENMIIYHWSDMGLKNGSVESFTALAKFRAYYTGRLQIYAAVVIGLGALGSAIQALFATGAGLLVIENSEVAWPTIHANVIAIVVLGIILWVIVAFSRPNPPKIIPCCRILQWTPLKWIRRITNREGR